MPVRLRLVLAIACALMAGGCAQHVAGFFPDATVASAEPPETAAKTASAVVDGYPVPAAPSAASFRADTPQNAAYVQPPAGIAGPHIVAEGDGPYLLDTGDKLRIFVYGQPGLSRQYIVGHDGRISVPLIGNVTARGRTTADLQAVIRAKLGSEYVRNPQVTVDVLQNRPFFIFGEVKAAGQYPYVSGMTVETAIAIAGGYSERASDRMFRITRRVNGFAGQIEAPGDFVLRPGDTVYVFERFF